MKVLQTNGLKAFMTSILDKFIKKEDTVEVETVDIDNIPTQNSNNLVKSGGVYTALTTKLTEPSTNLAIGKHFKIASIDADGHAVLECVDAPSAPIQSISAAGTALTPNEKGNVNIPIAKTHTVAGIVRGQLDRARQGISNVWANGNFGYTLYNLNTANSKWQTIRNTPNTDDEFAPILIKNMDYAYKLAMTDGIGTAWTDAERLAALLRMGCTVDENGYVKWTATPSE